MGLLIFLAPRITSRNSHAQQGQRGGAIGGRPPRVQHHDVIVLQADDQENVDQVAEEEQADIVAVLPDHNAADLDAAPVADEDIELLEEEEANHHNQAHRLGRRFHFRRLLGGETGQRGRRSGPAWLKIPHFIRSHLSFVFGGGAASAANQPVQHEPLDDGEEQYRDAMNSLPQGHESQSMEVVVSPSYYFEAFKYERILPARHGGKPNPRSGHRMVSDEKYVYMFGGYNPSLPEELCHELWRFSRWTRTWQLLHTTGSMPKEVASPCMVLLNSNQLLVYGGSGLEFGNSNSNKMYTCDLKRLQWEQVAYANDPQDRHMPMAGYGQSIAYDTDNHCLYVVGGTNGHQYHMYVHRFDLTTRLWELLSSDVPHVPPRYRHEIALYRNKLFVIGGGTNYESFSNEQIPVFDLTTKSWSQIPAKPWHDLTKNESVYPEPRFSHDIGHLGNLVVMVGGQRLNVDVPSSIEYSDTWALNLDTLQWTCYPSMRLPRPNYFNAVTMTPEGELFLFGGISILRRNYELGRQRNNQLRRAFFRVPSLQLLAMDAVRINLQRILSKTSNEPVDPDINQLKQMCFSNNINLHCLNLLNL